MEILYVSERLRDECNNEKALIKRLNKDGARRMKQRLSDLDAAAALEEMRPPMPGKCHELKADRKGQLAMTITGGKRLIFEPVDPDQARKADGGLNWSLVTAVRILGIEDYHK